MSAVKDQLKERKREFASYLRLLEHLESRFVGVGGTRRVGDLPTSDSFKAMKATGFLMLYNIIESTVVSAMAELYEKIRREACGFEEVSAQVRELWIDQRFLIAPHDATPVTYRNRAAEMLKETMDGTALNLSARRLPISGNIDAQAVRDICRKHGCRLVVHRHARGGAELETIRAQRNALAHGLKSFAECGQSYAASDIARISRECFNFLNSFVRSLARFVAKRQYRA